jgi:ABC-type transport system involved in multi-copper enzyme maturation permease subunit
VKRSKFNLNPIIVKEFRSRMRGWRSFLTLTVYLVLLGLFGYGIYKIMLHNSFYTSGMPLSPYIGRSLYSALANLSLFFVAFLTPALTAAAISSEQEKLTLEMLQATPLAPHTILFGKLISTTGYIFLLLFAAIPMFSLVFIFGGVTVADLLLAGLIIGTTAVTFGLIGLFFSAWRKRTIQAIVMSYLVILILIGGTYVVYIFWSIMSRGFPPRFLLLFNPFSALASVIAGGSQTDAFSFFGILAGWGPMMDDPALLGEQRPLWHYTLAFYLVLSTILYLLATRFIKPIRPWRMGRRGFVLLALILILYLGIGGTIFFKDIDRAINPPPIPPTPTPPPVFMRSVPVEVPVMRVAPVEPTAPPPPIPDELATEEAEIESDE